MMNPVTSRKQILFLFASFSLGWLASHELGEREEIRVSALTLIDPESGREAGRLQVRDGVPSFTLTDESGYRITLDPKNVSINPDKRGDGLVSAGVRVRPSGKGVVFFGSVDGSLNEAVVGLSAKDYFATIGGGAVIPRNSVRGRIGDDEDERD